MSPDQTQKNIEAELWRIATSDTSPSSAKVSALALLEKMSRDPNDAVPLDENYFTITPVKNRA